MQDIYSVIFTHITDFKTHMNFSFVSTSTYAISRRYICTIPKSICVKLLADNTFNSQISQFSSIGTLDLSSTLIIDLSALGNCHTLNLFDTKVSDVSALGKCHTLDLRCTNVSEIDIQKLKDSGVNVIR